jgi:hypothetical protein
MRDKFALVSTVWNKLIENSQNCLAPVGSLGGCGDCGAHRVTPSQWVRSKLAEEQGKEMNEFVAEE